MTIHVDTPLTFYNLYMPLNPYLIHNMVGHVGTEHVQDEAVGSRQGQVVQPPGLDTSHQDGSGKKMSNYNLEDNVQNGIIINQKIIFTFCTFKTAFKILNLN